MRILHSTVTAIVAILLFLSTVTVIAQEGPGTFQGNSTGNIGGEVESACICTEGPPTLDFGTLTAGDDARIDVTGWQMCESNDVTSTVIVSGGSLDNTTAGLDAEGMQLYIENNYANASEGAIKTGLHSTVPSYPYNYSVSTTYRATVEVNDNVMAGNYSGTYTADVACSLY